MSGLGGQGEPGESHQESVTNNQPTNRKDNQAIIEPSRSFESMVLNWLDLEFGNYGEHINIALYVQLDQIAVKIILSNEYFELFVHPSFDKFMVPSQ